MDRKESAFVNLSFLVYILCRTWNKRFKSERKEVGRDTFESQLFVEGQQGRRAALIPYGLSIVPSILHRISCARGNRETSMTAALETR